MTAPVDVLAVMDALPRAVDAYEREGSHRYFRDGAYHMELSRQHYAAGELGDQLLEARAAVAELIEAAEWKLRDGTAAQMCGHGYTCTCADTRLRAALARAGGEL